MLFTLPNGQSFKGIIDRLDYLADGTLIINDYKTGKKLPVERENYYISQLSLYSYGLQQAF
jgi:RecB family exonuclease